MERNDSNRASSGHTRSTARRNKSRIRTGKPYLIERERYVNPTFTASGWLG
jgi:hypothetical protein